MSTMISPLALGLQMGLTTALPMQAIQVLGPGTVPYMTRQRIQLM